VISQAEAAALTGVPLASIEWWCRQGGIVTRPRDGLRPSLSRESVVEFAIGYHARARRREERRTERERAKARRQPPRASRQKPPRRPDGCLTSAEAGELIGLKRARVLQLLHAGVLAGIRDGGRWWVSEAAAKAYAAERSQWLSIPEAQTMLGCGEYRVARAIEAGQIEQRSAPRAWPSLSRSSVEAFASVWAEERARNEAAAEARRIAEERRGSSVPDDEHEWLNAREAALVLNLSPTRVGQLARDGRLPHSVARGKRWYRRDHVELVARARQFRRQDGGPLPPTHEQGRQTSAACR
jgi:hypothetical protein